MEVIPWALAENAGLDAIDVVIQLKSAHEKKNGKNMGINLDTGKPDRHAEAQRHRAAPRQDPGSEVGLEVANMILRIDDVIASRKAPPIRQADRVECRQEWAACHRNDVSDRSARQTNPFSNSFLFFFQNQLIIDIQKVTSITQYPIFITTWEG